MYTYPMTLDSTGHLGAGEAKIFEIIDTPTKGSISAVMADALTSPRQMKISHISSSPGGVATSRHLVRLDLQVADSEGVNQQASVYTVLVVPVSQTTITEAMVLNLVGQNVDFLTNTDNVTELLAGQI